MIHVPKVYADPSTLLIPVWVDENVAGVQFKLHYNSAAASYEFMQAAPGASGLANESMPGTLLVVVSSAVNLAETVCSVALNLTGSTVLSITDAKGATEQAQTIDLEVDDGEILIGVDMDVLVAWQDNNPANVGVTGYNIYRGSNPNPAVGTWNKVATVNVPASDHRLSLNTGQGLVFFYVTAFNDVGESSPSGTASINTDLPVPVENVTVTVV